MAKTCTEYVIRNYVSTGTLCKGLHCQSPGDKHLIIVNALHAARGRDVITAYAARVDKKHPNVIATAVAEPVQVWQGAAATESMLLKTSGFRAQGRICIGIECFVIFAR